jgi:hypothetical protein
MRAEEAIRTAPWSVGVVRGPRGPGAGTGRGEAWVKPGPSEQVEERKGMH